MPKPKLPFYVIGHRNPDTDAICSAIGHAALLRETGDEPDAVAARCGDVPTRTAWVLEKAGIAEPPLVQDVRATAGMICRRGIVRSSADDTFLEAYRSMLASGVRCVPVVDEDNKVQGILRYLDLLELLLPGDGSQEMMARTVRVSLRKICSTLNAQSVGADLPEACEDENITVLIGASSQVTVNRRLKRAVSEGTIGDYMVMCGDRPVVQHYAIENGARVLLVTGDNGVEPQLRELARQRGVVIMMCAQDTASAITMIRCSRTVEHVMETDFTTVSSSDPVNRLRKSLASHAQDLFPVIDDRSGEMVGVLSKSDLVDPPRTRVALVDHNEYAQAVSGVEEAHVVEVIDHHRLAGDLISREPIRYLNEPVGSTSTLVARKFLYRDLVPEPGVAICLAAGIISDTLCLTSPTTTELDRSMLKWLSEIAKVDPEEFKAEFFAVGSLLKSAPVEELLNADRKEFDDEGARVTIAQIEELGLDAFEGRKDELLAGLQKVVDDQKYDLAVLAVTDIATHHSMVLAAGDPNMVEALPFESLGGGVFDAPGVVSRKKQLFPAVCQAILKAR